MKKDFKRLMLMAVIGICSLFVGTIVSAKGLTITSQQLICDPQSIEAGGNADCYIIGSADNATDVSHGIIVQFYTTDKLSVTGAKVNDKIKASAGALIKRPQDQTTGNGGSLDAVDGVKNFSCDLKIDRTGETRDAGCIVFYTAGTANAVFTRANLGKPTTLTKSLSDRIPDESTLVVLGNMTVKLDKDNQAEACGNVCWQTWTIPTADDYARYATCQAATPGTPGCGETPTSVTPKECEELHMKTGNPENTITGSFVSYTILAAGILLAISAVAIAKKNNKLQKI